MTHRSSSSLRFAISWVHRALTPVPVLLAILLAAVPSFAQVTPDARFPDGTNVKVYEEALRSLGGASFSRLVGMMPEIKSAIEAYADYGKTSDSGFPESTLKCENPDTENVWKADSLLQLADLVKFTGCFEPHVKLDMPVTFKPCVNFKVTFYEIVTLDGEICMDPPPGFNNCCASSNYVLEECGFDKPDRLKDIGYRLKFWWPENTAQINNYEVAIFDPPYECNNTGNGTAPDDPDFDVRHSTLMESDLYEGGLKITRAKMGREQGEKAEYTRDEAGIAERPLPERPNIGQSHWAGIQPGDQTFHAEAHVHNTYLNTVGRMNKTGTRDGYRYNCSCFYNLLDHWDKSKDRIVNGWTELPKFLHYWRFWQLSEELGQYKYEAIRDFSSPITDLCASYRAYLAPWSDRYKDLIPSIKVEPPGGAMGQQLARICYRGGGELFPINGNLIGHFSPLPAAAYISRRAFYLFGRPTLDTGVPFMPDGRRMNRYSDNDDKMQRVYPRNSGFFNSQCFRGHEIPNYLEEGNDNWPRDLVRPAELFTNTFAPGEDIRYTHWNKRDGCMCPISGPIVLLKLTGSALGGTVSIDYKRCTIEPACRLKNRGDYEDDPTGVLGGYGGHDLGSLSIEIPILKGDLTIPGSETSVGGQNLGDNLTIDTSSQVNSSIPSGISDIAGSVAMGIVALTAPYPFLPAIDDEALLYKLKSGKKCKLKPQFEQCSSPYNPQRKYSVGSGSFSILGYDFDFLKYDGDFGSNSPVDNEYANVCLPEWKDSDGGLQCDTLEPRCD